MSAVSPVIIGRALSALPDISLPSQSRPLYEPTEQGFFDRCNWGREHQTALVYKHHTHTAAKGHRYTWKQADILKSDILNDMFQQLIRAELTASTEHTKHHMFSMSLRTELRRQLETSEFFVHYFLTEEHTNTYAANDIPDYSSAFARLNTFASEEVNWDGCGGLPASAKVVENVKAFLIKAQLQRIAEPGLAMGGDGSVAVIWSSLETYITADFSSGDGYIFIATHGSNTVSKGIQEKSVLNSNLLHSLKKYFKDDERN